MRLTTFILMISLLQVSAITFGQRFTMQKKNASLNEVFTEIRKQTGYFVIYADDKIDASVKLDINFKQTDLKDVLSFIGKNQELQYTIDDKNISFKPKDPTFLERLAERWASIDVNGRVVDTEGKPLPGATVKVKATGKGVSTDGRGNFHLKNVEEGAVLVVSYTGYVSKEVSAAKDMGNVVLEVSLSKLDEVQVIAYGTTTQRLSTGNVTTIKADVIEKQPVNNPLLALQGRVPGLFVTQTSGVPGAGVNVRIQGENSIESGNNPLYVVDGVPFSSALLPSISNPGGYAIIPNGSPMNFINPSDIESIDVLKDADATAIYGSRAANGAILITTKKGKSGQTKVDVNMQSGWGQITRKMKLLDTKQYINMRREAIANDGKTISPTDYDINGTWDTTRYTDWQKVFIGNTAHYTDIQGSVSGGNNNTQYLIGTTYHRETTVFPGTFSDRKVAVHFNINNVSSNQKFRILFSGNYLADNSNLPNTDFTAYSTLSPNAPPLYNKDGSLNWEQDATGNSIFFYNPAAYLYNKYKLNTSNLLGNALISYEVLPDLSIKSSFGYTNLQSYAVIAVSALSFQPELLDQFNPRSGNYSTSNSSTWIVEPQLTYNHQIGKGKFEALLGGTFQQTNNNQVQMSASGFLSDAVIEDIASSTQHSIGSSVADTYKYSGTFSRLKYTYNEKYIINLNGRRDGSSRFGEKNQFHNFGSIAFAWIFSAENAIKNVLPFINFGKLRASYGITGNDQISNYKFLDLYYPIYNVNVPYQGVSGLQPVGISNPYIAWEQTKKTQFGIDLGILSDKVFLSINYNHNRSSSQLLDYVLPVFTGTQSVVTNFPATIQNSGWEFSTSTKNINTNHFTWSSDINLTIPKNVLVAFPDLATSSYASTLEIGKAVMSKRLYQSLGVDSQTGIYQFKDSNGNPTVNPSYSDRNILVKTYPEFYGGLQNSFRYKGFSLSFLFQFVKQKAFSPKFGGAIYPGGNYVNQPNTVLDRWQKEGDNTPFPKFTARWQSFQSWSNLTNSDATWDDASFIRLKNLSLSWQVPDPWKKKIHLNDFQLFASGQNLLTFTKYIGNDPETLGVYSLPPLRVLTLGFRITL